MTENGMLNYVKKVFPDLVINEVELNNNGWDNEILIINKNIVFRFPKSKDVVPTLIYEDKILKLLNSKNPLLQVPEYEFIYDDCKVKGVMYPFLEGKSLSEYPIKYILNNPDNAKRIGDFLTKLHSIDLAEVDGTNIKTIHTINYWENLYEKVKSNIFPFLSSQQQGEISHLFDDFLENFQSLTYKKVIIHGDLTVSNIIYSKEKKRINGIIDFTDAQIGDPAFDFAGLYWSIGPNFTKDVLSWYQSSEPLDSIFNRVSKFYGLQPVFHDLLYAIKNNQKINWVFALERFSYLYTLQKV